jgi:transcriptional regulator with XRE-family HTH domain
MGSIVPVQCWMARTALGWGVRDLARAAEVSPDTVTRFERGDALKEITVEVIQRTLERAGVVFIGVSGGGPGARLERSRGAAERQLTASSASAI